MSGTANRDELMATFADVAGVDAERSRFFLEAAGWELDVSLNRNDEYVIYLLINQYT